MGAALAPCCSCAWPGSVRPFGSAICGRCAGDVSRALSYRYRGSGQLRVPSGPCKGVKHTARRTHSNQAHHYLWSLSARRWPGLGMAGAMLGAPRGLCSMEKFRSKGPPAMPCRPAGRHSGAHMASAVGARC